LLEEEIGMTENPRSVEANSLKDEGIKLFRYGEYDEAAELFQKAQTLYEELGDVKGQAEMLNNVGAVRTQQERWDDAAEAFAQARSTFERLEDTDGQAQTLGNMGTMYRNQGDNEAAVEHLKQAVDLFAEAADRDKQAATLRLISRIRLGQAKWLEALHFYDLSLACVEPPRIKQRTLRRLIQVPFGLLSRPQ
jgi:tetratricopeptide (TPR) repeat protein